MGDPDLVDYIAAGVFGLCGVATGGMGFFLLVTLIGIPLGIPFLVAGVLLWYAAKGVFSRDREAWWVGVLVVAVLTATGTLLGGLSFIAGWQASVLIGIGLLTYLLVRRERYGVGVPRGTGYETSPPRDKEHSPGPP